MFDSIWFWIILLIVVAVLAYRFAPGVKDKADEFIDRDDDGRPFR